MFATYRDRGYSRTVIPERSSSHRRIGALLLPLLLLGVAAVVAPGGCFRSRNLPDGGTFLCNEFDPSKTDGDFCPEGFYCDTTYTERRQWGVCAPCADAECPTRPLLRLDAGGADSGGPGTDAATDAGPDSGNLDGGGA